MLHRLRNPLERPLELGDRTLRLSIDIYLALDNASQCHYDGVCRAILQSLPDVKTLSYHEVKQKIAEITGVSAIKHDMCINSCIGYTGPFSSLERCPECLQPRYDQDVFMRSGKKTVRKQFTTVPIGPQIQVRHASKESSLSMDYHEACMQDIYHKTYKPTL